MQHKISLKYSIPFNEATLTIDHPSYQIRLQMSWGSIILLYNNLKSLESAPLSLMATFLPPPPEGMGLWQYLVGLPLLYSKIPANKTYNWVYLHKWTSYYRNQFQSRFSMVITILWHTFQSLQHFGIYQYMYRPHFATNLFNRCTCI